MGCMRGGGIAPICAERNGDTVPSVLFTVTAMCDTGLAFIRVKCRGSTICKALSTLGAQKDNMSPILLVDFR